jgi:hypothetical protein
MYVRRKHSLKPSCLETRISEEDQEKRAMMRLEIAREQKLLMKSQLGMGVASYGEVAARELYLVDSEKVVVKDRYLIVLEMG